MFDFIRGQKVNFTFKRNKRKRAFRNLETMERVLILFHHTDWMQIQLVANDLERMGKKVILWTAESDDNSIVNIRIPLLMRVLSKNDFSRAGILKSKTKQEFESIKYDTLIDFCKADGEGAEYMSYLLALNEAEFCIGNREHEENIFDFIVFQQEGKGVLETFGQMKHYLKNIVS